MPVYLFTYHTYRSWMPDRPKGYTKRNAGYQKPDPVLARIYNDRARHSPVLLDAHLQRCAIDRLLASCRHLSLRCHAIATDPSHIHVLVSWKHTEPWETIRATLRRYLTRTLRAELASDEGTHDRAIFSRSASRKRVKDDTHLQYLLTRYLPSHRGEAWSEGAVKAVRSSRSKVRGVGSVERQRHESALRPTTALLRSTQKSGSP